MTVVLMMWKQANKNAWSVFQVDKISSGVAEKPFFLHDSKRNRRPHQTSVKMLLFY